MKLKYEKNITSLTNSTLDQQAVEGTNRLKSVNNTVIISQLLNKLTDYLPFIQIYMKTLVVRIQTLQTILTKISENLEEIQEKIQV